MEKSLDIDDESYYWNPGQEDTLCVLDRVDILIVDDIREKLQIYQSILEDLGQNIIVANSGEEGLKYVLKHEFAVILLDVNMPGLDGFETATLIRKRKKSASTPIIFLTAFTDEVLVAQGYASGAVDYLPTPVVPEVLRAKVRVFIELFQMRRRAACQAEEQAKRKAAEEFAHRSALRAKFSALLARSQNQQEILHTLTRRTLPYLADVSIAVLIDENKLRHLEWYSRELQGGDNVPPLPTLPWFEEALEKVVSTGRYQLWSQLPASLQPEQNAPNVKSFLSLKSAIVFPIMVRDKVCGVFALARKHQNAYEESEISLISDLVNRFSVALENILLIEKIREADRCKDAFLGMLAHELRNPLAPIKNAVYLLQWIGSKEPQAVQLKEIVYRQVGHMTRLIDDLLDATRLARGQILLQKEYCNLTLLIQQVAIDYKPIFETKGLYLEVDIPDMPIWLMGDSTRLTQAVGNLLHNAHKFTDSGGTITMCLRYDERLKKAIFTVKDSGIGISEDILPHIFNVFYQQGQGLDRKRGGLGLGLSLVKGLVELHEGTVSVSSQGIGKGAEFTIQFPAELFCRIDKEEDKGAEEVTVSRILIIEDHQDTAETAKQFLSFKGYDVRIAHEGAAGLKLAKVFTPDVILCDIGLPGLNGYEIVQAIRKDPLLESISIIALSGYGRGEDQQKAYEAGFDLHLNKPVDCERLHRTLEEILSAKKMRLQNKGHYSLLECIKY